MIDRQRGDTAYGTTIFPICNASPQYPRRCQRFNTRIKLHYTDVGQRLGVSFKV